ARRPRSGGPDAPGALSRRLSRPALGRSRSGSGPNLDEGRARALGDLAEVGVVVALQLLEVARLEKALERRLALELVERHVLVLVLAHDRLVAPRADRALELQQLRAVLLVVPAIERLLLLRRDRGFDDEQDHRHGFSSAALMAAGCGLWPGPASPDDPAPFWRKSRSCGCRRR